AILGMVKIALPWFNRDQGFINCSSDAPAMAFRAEAVFLSKRPNSSAWDFSCGGAGASFTSKEYLGPVAASQPVMVARCKARLPMVIDLSCGFQADLSSGTRSRLFRVFVIS